MLTPHLSLPTLATEALLCIVRTPAASLLASSPPLFCVTLCPSLKRERWIRSGSRVWKGRESEIASDRGEKRGRGHLEGGMRREKRRFSLIYAIAVPHLFIVAPCQLKKRDMLIASLLISAFSLIFFCGHRTLRLLPLIDCTHAHII